MIPELIHVEMEGKTHAMTFGDLIDDAIYRNYAFNRTRSPSITPKQWALIFGDTTQLEARYQASHASQ